MDTAQWTQGIGAVKQQQSAIENQRLEKKPRPQKEQALNCPRCNSTNTKFCYYNNYSLSQPRYFCKTCRRYWTEGGSLRKVPVGGGSRKNRRTSSSSLQSKKVIPDLSPQVFSSQNSKIHQGQDLNLAYNPSHYTGISSHDFSFPFCSDYNTRNIDSQNPNNLSSSSSSPFPVMELLKTSISSRGLTSFIPLQVSDNSNPVFSSGFPPSLSFSLDGLDQNGYGNLQSVEDPSRTLFPFEELKPSAANSSNQFNRNTQGESNGYWNGMLTEGSW